MNNENERLRLAIVGIVVVSLFAALFSRLWYLQVLDSAEFVKAAEGNQVRIVYEEAPRGRILDRQGRVIVDNRISEIVTVTRDAAKKSPDVLDRLAVVLGKPVEELRARVTDPRFTPFKPIPVAEDVAKEAIVYIEEHQADFEGVATAQVTERAYPHGALAAHVLGSVGQVNDEDLTKLEGRGYQPGDSVGKSGVERAYERVLRGEPGAVKLEVNSRGRVLRTLFERPPVQGHDLQLAIDIDIQRAAEESLAEGLAAARTVVDKRNTGKPFVAPGGAVVVQDPNDGSVLALASHPTFDPSVFVNGIPAAKFAELQDPANHLPLNNRATAGQYAPGSTFKLVTALAALDKGLIEPRTTLVDKGQFELPVCRGEKCVFRNAGGTPYGAVNLSRAMAVSSDVFFYSLGYRFWVERGKHGATAIQDKARALGLGEKTGIEITESGGRLADPETRKRLNEASPDRFPNGQWFAGDNINLAIGQGEMAITPLQLNNAYATFANGGTRYQPRLAIQALDAKGQSVERFEPVVTGKVEMSAAGRASLLAGLRGAISDARGTARVAFAGFPLDKLAIGGKTGTAQVQRKQDTALFASFAPVDAPQYAVSVVMEEAGFGGSVAAPVARRVYEVLAGIGPSQIVANGSID